MDKINYLDLAKQAFDASTTYFESNYRADFEYSLRAFRNEHAPGSKYLSDEYKSRSRVFDPKTRTIIRKNEAAAMQAAFSNQELVQVEPANPNNLMNVASAAALKEVLEYRLSRTIPTFEIYLGGVQDAQTMGAVCSHQYWEYEKRNGKKTKDKPCIELRPLENIRFDPGSSWLDPVNTSPYWCDIIPMYVCDVKAMMENEDEKTGAPKWKKFEDSVIEKARPDLMDSTRRARLGNQQDPEQERTAIKAFDIVWVLRWCMKGSRSDDFCYYTLGTEDLLTEAKPLEEVYFHGVRPYVMGYSILETHKALKTGVPILSRPLQQSANQLRNSRFDNVQLVLNKRYYVARGRQVDVQSLVRNVAGGVTLMTDPKNDVVEANWQDVTSSSYAEEDRIHSSFDDLVGNFSPSTKVANNAVNDTLGGSRMAAAGAGLMTEYLIRTINETWWSKVMRQLALLEQHYETDEVILGVCAEKAQLFPKFGMSRITDLMLTEEVLVSVDMAMGDPNQRMQKFLMVTNAAVQLHNVAAQVPGANVKEMTDELYATSGYRNSGRFFNQQQDPKLMKAMQMIQQLQGQVNGEQMKLQAGLQETQLKLTSNEKIKGAELQVDAQRISGDLRIREAELLVEQQKLRLEELKLQITMRGSDQELQMRAAELQADINTAEVKLQGEREKQAHESMKAQHEVAKSALELQRAQAEQQNESRIGEVANQVTESMNSVGKEIAAIKQDLTGMTEIKGQVDELKKGLGAMVGVMMQPKKKAKGFKFKKSGGKRTTGVMVEYDDGSTEDLPVHIEGNA